MLSLSALSAKESFQGQLSQQQPQTNLPFGKNQTPAYYLCGGQANNAYFAWQAYNEDFRPIGPSFTPSGNWSQAAGPINYQGWSNFSSAGAGGTAYELDANLGSAVLGNSQSYPSSGGTSTCSNYTCRFGEFGHDYLQWDAYGNMSSWQPRNGGFHGIYENYSFVNSDHPDQRYALMFYNGKLAIFDRAHINAGMVANLNGTGGKRSAKAATNTAASTAASQLGSASYNYSRKEFLQAATNANNASGALVLKLYKGVDLTNIETLPGLSTVLNEANAIERLVTLSGCPAWTTEARYRMTPVLCGDGSIFLVLNFCNYGIYAWKVTRSADDSSWTLANAGSPVQLVACSGTTYGLDQANYWGMFSMQSRDGRQVLSVAPYYYYGAGLIAIAVDKTGGGNLQTIQFADTTYGYSTVHWKNDGFGFMKNGSLTASGVVSSGPNSLYVESQNVDGTFNFNPSLVFANLNHFYAGGYSSPSYPAWVQLCEVN